MDECVPVRSGDIIKLTVSRYADDTIIIHPKIDFKCVTFALNRTKTKVRIFCKQKLDVKRHQFFNAGAELPK